MSGYWYDDYEPSEPSDDPILPEIPDDDGIAEEGETTEEDNNVSYEELLPEQEQ